jgi:hypothetical protein
MANPSYKGQGQPAAASGGWLSALFGTQTPAYKSAPVQPAAVSSAAPSASASGSGTAAPSAIAATVVPVTSAMGCETDGLPSFAIVIPREIER